MEPTAPPAPVSTEESKTEKNTKKQNKKKKNKEIKEPYSGEDKGEALNLQTIKNVLSTLDQDAPASSKRWKFWDTQPVTKFHEVVNEVGVIEANKEQVREQPYSLPAEFEWDTIELDNKSQLEEVYELLNENYVEDEDNMFRFDYSAQFLQWALRPPGWLSYWHCGVRVKKSRKLVGFISAIPANIRVYDVEQKMVEINFLCVHKKLRHKRVAPVLIKEITRRVNIKGIFQAVYTAGVVLPKPVAKCKYYHRSLNPRKLVNVKFSHLSRNQTMQRLVKLMRLPEEPLIKGIRELKQEDIPQCHKLLGNHLKKFQLSPVFTEEEFAHFFKPRNGIIYTYVVPDENGVITDMSSFFSLPSSIMLNPEYNMLHAAYSYYTVATKYSITEIMKDILILAKKNDFDVFNALDLMDNHQFLKELKFGMGDGSLNYYLYNFKCPDITENQVALVLQ